MSTGAPEEQQRTRSHVSAQVPAQGKGRVTEHEFARDLNETAGRHQLLDVSEETASELVFCIATATSGRGRQ